MWIFKNDKIYWKELIDKYIIVLLNADREKCFDKDVAKRRSNSRKWIINDLEKYKKIIETKY